MTREDLLQVKAEMERFKKRLDAAISASKTDNYFFFGCKLSGAVKRGAIDLKNELTKITK